MAQATPATQQEVTGAAARFQRAKGGGRKVAVNYALGVPGTVLICLCAANLLDPGEVGLQLRSVTGRTSRMWYRRWRRGRQPVHAAESLRPRCALPSPYSLASNCCTSLLPGRQSTA